MTPSITATALRDFVTKEFGHLAAGEVIDDDFGLVTHGIIDSLGIFTLLDFIERELGVDIPDDELVVDNFSSIGTIAALVEEKRSRPQG